MVISVCLFVYPPVFMVQFGSLLTDFHEILRMNIFRKAVEKLNFC